MIDLVILPVYLTAVVALLLLPGPDMLLIASSSMSYGKKVGVFASLGNATSGVLLTLLAALGVSSLVAMSPYALKVLHLVGGAYLLKLSWDCLKVSDSPLDSNQEQSAISTKYYQRALMSNLLNPKALLFFIMFLPQFVSLDIKASYTEQMLALGLLLNGMGLAFNLLLVLLAGTVGKKLIENERFRIYQHKVMGAVFLLLALWMLSGFQL